MKGTIPSPFRARRVVLAAVTYFAGLLGATGISRATPWQPVPWLLDGTITGVSPQGSPGSFAVGDPFRLALNFDYSALVLVSEWSWGLRLDSTWNDAFRDIYLSAGPATGSMATTGVPGQLRGYRAVEDGFGPGPYYQLSFEVTSSQLSPIGGGTSAPYFQIYGFVFLSPEAVFPSAPEFYQLNPAGVAPIGDVLGGYLSADALVANMPWDGYDDWHPGSTRRGAYMILREVDTYYIGQVTSAQVLYTPPVHDGGSMAWLVMAGGAPLLLVARWRTRGARALG